MDFNYTTETISPDNTTALTVGGTDALIIPSGTTVQEIGTTDGAIRYNTSTLVTKVRESGTWKPLGLVRSFSFTQPGTQVTLGGAAIDANGNQSITLTLANDLASINALSGTGIPAITATDTWTLRTLTAGSSNIVITNGDGVAGNPTIDVDITGNSATGTISSWTLLNGNLYTGTFTHSLNSVNVVVSVYDSSTNKIIIPDSITMSDANTVTITITGNTTTVRVVVVQTSAVGQGAQTIRSFTYTPSSFDNPNNADWAVNALAPATADPTNGAINVRQFSNTTEQGVGVQFPIPSTATNITFTYKGRSQTAQGSAETLQFRAYTRLIPNNVAMGSWSAANTLASVSVPANSNFQYYTTTVTLASLSLTAGNTYQIEFTRNTGVGGNLAANFLLVEMTVAFT